MKMHVLEKSKLKTYYNEVTGSRLRVFCSDDVKYDK
jgi:hypothetical protein